MTYRHPYWVTGLILAVCSAQLHAATLAEAIAGGTVQLNSRLRYENAQQDHLAREANALTLRTRLAYTTAAWSGFDAQLEFEGTSVLGDDDYNSGDNGRTQFPVIADPKGSEFNQAWIRYTGLPQTTLRLGRQRLILDNARFIGNVGWRQNEQTFDALWLGTRAIPGLYLQYAYLDNVNMFRSFPINGANDNDLAIGAHLLNGAVQVVERALHVSTYAYLLDFDAIPAPALARQDTRTLGLRATGAQTLRGLQLDYALEYADQRAYQDAPDDVHASYQLAELALGGGGVKGTLGYERLSGDGGYSFQTPLATLHAFQGWADIFLVTPAAGIRDRYLSLGARLGRLSLLAAHHDYRADAGDADYGTELNLQATHPLARRLNGGIKYAHYRADSFPVSGGETFDTRRLWVWAEYAF
jgi:hypothetical protein